MQCAIKNIKDPRRGYWIAFVNLNVRKSRFQDIIKMAVFRFNIKLNVYYLRQNVSTSHFSVELKFLIFQGKLIS